MIGIDIDKEDLRLNYVKDRTSLLHHPKQSLFHVGVSRASNEGLGIHASWIGEEG